MTGQAPYGKNHLKGTRKMRFIKRAWAEIHLDSLKENCENYKKLIAEKSPETQLLCVVKADCYGHGSPVCTKYLQRDLGAKWFAVSNLNEAIELRNNGIEGNILILGYTPPEYADLISEYRIIQAITGYDYAVELSNSAKAPVLCHIKLDTGMTRIGLRFEKESDYINEIRKIIALDNLEVEGIFTHLCVADSYKEEDKEFTSNQIRLFNNIYNSLKAEGIELKEHHYLNSAGGVFHNYGDSTLARLGIIMYGLKPDASLKMPFELKPAMELKAVVSQVKEVEEGVSVSYGRTYFTKGVTKIATVAIGYADGVPRSLSNKGELLVNGKRAKIIGKVCMDQLMLDVTGIDVKAGDVAVVIGKSGDQTITADDIAGICGTIGYEIVCDITKRVPRRYFIGDKLAYSE